MNAVQKKIFAGLLWLQLEKNYRDGWAAVTFFERYGFWPERYGVEPVKPSAALEAYAKKKIRAFAKRRRQAERRQELKAGAPRKGSRFDTTFHNHMRAIMREGKNI